MLLFLVVLTTYYAIHSLLAATVVKAWILQMPFWRPYYRLGYNVLAILLLFPVGYTYSLFQKKALWASFWLNQSLGVLFLLLGIWMLYQAMQRYSMLEFIGLDQFRPATKIPPTLQTKGLNRLVRHPLYFAIVMLITGLVLLFPHTGTLSLAVVTFLYLILGIRWEEKKLLLQFGKAYADYKTQVPMLLPFKKWHL